MAQTIPLASHEVRWFFAGKAQQQAALQRWFETTAPMPKRPGVGPPVWQGRLDDHPDVYLLVPGSDDMGIKWREGELQLRAGSLPSGRRCSAGGIRGQWNAGSSGRMPTPQRRITDCLWRRRSRGW
jgi:hypothetical protein